MINVGILHLVCYSLTQGTWEKVNERVRPLNQRSKSQRGCFKIHDLCTYTLMYTTF